MQSQSRNFTNALTPLINHGWMSSVRAHLTPKNVSQGVCIGVGAMAGVFYLALAQLCAEKESCGLWLSKLTTPFVAKSIFLVAGGGGYAATNAIQSKDGVNSAFEYVSSHTSTSTKIRAASLLLLLTSTQMGQNLISCLASDQTPAALAIVMFAAISPALYGTVATIKTDIPRLYFNIKWRASQFYLNHLARNLDETQTDELERIDYYDRAFESFTQQIQANMQAVINTAKSVVIEENEKPETFLMKQNAEYQAPSFLDKAVHYSSLVFGTALGSCFSVPFAYATLATLMENNLFSYIPKPLDYIIVGTTGLAILYGNIRFTAVAVSTVELAKDLIVGNPIKSLPVKLHPTLSPVIGGICTAVASMSYAAGHYFADTYYTGPYKTAMTYLTMAGISTFHWQGYWELFPTALAALSRNKTERFLFEVEHRANELQNDKAGFIEKIETDPAFSALVNVAPFDKPRPPVKTWGETLGDACCFFRSKRHHEAKDDLKEILVPTISSAPTL